MANVDVDLRGVKELGREIEEMQKILLARLGERGYQLLRDEVPVDTGNLKQGVAPPDIAFPVASLTVSARSARTGSGQATVYGSDGERKKTISLRPTAAYNYAEVVARGNKDATLRPTRAKAFLIPVATAPSDEGYLVIGGKIYIVRRSRKGRAANPYDERAANRLESEAQRIADAVLAEFN